VAMSLVILTVHGHTQFSCHCVCIWYAKCH